MMADWDWSMGFRAPDKQRFLAALRREETGEVAYHESGIAPEIISVILGKAVGPNEGNQVLSPHDAVELARRMGMDMVNLNQGWVFGRRVHHDKAGRRVFLEGLIHTRDDIKRLQHPSLDTIKRRFDEMLPALEGTGLGINYMLDTTPALVIRALGYDKYFLNIYDDPGLIHEFNNRVDQWVLSSTEFVLEQGPVDSVELSANLCDKNGPMFSPKHIDEFCFEPMRRQLALIHSKGIPCILHTDGDNGLLLDSFIAMGIDAIHPVEPCPKSDIYQLKERYGDRLCFMGNIDLADVLVFGTPEEVTTDTAEHIWRLAPGGGYVCGSSHDINYNVPLENLYAMIKTVSEAKWTPTLPQVQGRGS
jgi:uroporphyrinogen decarboxylase